MTDVTTTGTPPFEEIRHLLSGKPPRRPKRTGPIQGDFLTSKEFLAWEKASDEALDNFQAQIEMRAT